MTNVLHELSGSPLDPVLPTLRVHLAMSVDTLVVTVRGSLLVGTSYWSAVKEPKVLLNILQSTGEIPTTKNHVFQNVISAEVEKPCGYSRAFVKTLSICGAFIISQALKLTHD